MKRGKGRSLGEALSAIANRLDRKGGGALTQARVMEAWSRVAGSSVLKHTTGAHIRDGEMIVFVDSPVWATELSALSEQYREAVAEQMGQVPVRSVRFSVSRKVSDEARWAAAERRAEEKRDEDDVEPIPLSQQERDQIESSASGIPDEELREAVTRATIADLEWKKGIAAAKRRQKPREGA